MRKSLIVAGLALGIGAAPLAAQDARRCFIEVQKLVAPAPAGLGELGGAIRQLDDTLRPQVEEVKRLKQDVERLQARQRQAMADEDGDTDMVALEGEMQRADAALAAGHERLRADYAAQQKAIVGPVQTRVAERAHTFGAERGCAEIKMARPPDLAALQSDGARDLTGDFVAWYEQGQS